MVTHTCDKWREIDRLNKEVEKSQQDRRELSEKQTALTEQNKTIMQKLDDIEAKLDKIMGILDSLDERYDKRYAEKKFQTGLEWALKIVGSAVVIALLAQIWLWGKQ